jgi:SSS family solute:Na+ symporter
MIGGAYLLAQMHTKTLQDTASELGAVIAGGLLGLYMLGFFTTRGDGRAVALGILFAVGFSAFISMARLGWLPHAVITTVKSNFDIYYTGLMGNVVMFTIGFALARVLPARQRDLKNLTVWTQDKVPVD